jgi:hypothetical protein
MAVLFVLTFSEKEYDSFKRLTGANLAYTYKEWEKLINNEVTEAKRCGDPVAEIQVKYDEFIAYCKANGTDADSQVLLSFFEIKKTEWQAKQP